MFLIYSNNQLEDCILSPKPSISSTPNSLQMGTSGILWLFCHPIGESELVGVAQFLMNVLNGLAHGSVLVYGQKHLVHTFNVIYNEYMLIFFLKLFRAFKRSMVIAVYDNNEFIAFCFGVIKVLNVAIVYWVEIATYNDCILFHKKLKLAFAPNCAPTTFILICF